MPLAIEPRNNRYMTRHHIRSAVGRLSSRLALREKLPDRSSDLPARQHASVPCPDTCYPVPHPGLTPLTQLRTPPGGPVPCDDRVTDMSRSIG